MKNLFLLLLFPLTLSAQEVSLHYTVSSDTVLFGNKIILKITAENTKIGEQFPEFQDFDVLGAPRTSFQTSIINGDMTSSQSYTFYLKPLREGIAIIEPLSIMDENGNNIDAEPLYIQVLPNPEGIIEEPKLDEKQNDFFFNFDDPFKNDPFRSEPFDLKPPTKKKPKKRRPTYKI